MTEPVDLSIAPVDVGHMPPVREIGWLGAALPVIRKLPRARGKLTRTLLETWLLPSRARVAFPLSDGLFLTGSQMSLDMIAHIMVHRGWDEHVLAICRDALSPDGVFYDIGANSGYFSLAMARWLQPDGQVVAFEPLAPMAQDIALAARHNGLGNLAVYNVALAAASGEETLFLPTQSVHASFVAREADAGSIKVRTIALDDLVASGAIPPPTVIKLDVEGAEMLVLDGAQSTLSTHLPLICFECDDNSLRFGHSPAAMIARLRAMGYTRFEAAARDGTRTPLGPHEEAHADFGDFVARA